MRHTHLARVAAVALVACTKPEPLPAAAGSLVFVPDAMVVSPDGGTPVDMSAGILATEVEVVRSDGVLRAAVRARGLASAFKLDEDATVETLRKATSASRRGQSLILEVSVRLPDPSLAKASCTAILSAYVDSRLQLRVDAAAAREAWLLAQLETVDASSPLAASLRADADEAAVERTARAVDVRVLDGCTISSAM